MTRDNRRYYCCYRERLILPSPPVAAATTTTTTTRRLLLLPFLVLLLLLLLPIIASYYCGSQNNNAATATATVIASQPPTTTTSPKPAAGGRGGGRRGLELQLLVPLEEEEENAAAIAAAASATTGLLLCHPVTSTTTTNANDESNYSPAEAFAFQLFPSLLLSCSCSCYCSGDDDDDDGSGSRERSGNSNSSNTSSSDDEDVRKKNNNNRRRRGGFGGNGTLNGATISQRMRTTSTAEQRRQLEEEEEEETEEEEEVVAVSNYVLNGCMALLCVILGALASGLTVGLLSLDPLLLIIKERAGATDRERQQASDLIPIVRQHHRLLVTLLLLSTVAGEALPIFLEKMVPGAAAVVASVVLVLVFGEIVPTAVFTGPDQLRIASQLSPVVKILMWIMFPVAYPMAKLLDRIMLGDNDDDNDNNNDEDASDSNDNDSRGGSHHHHHTGGGGTLYNRGELAALIRVQYEERLIAKRRRKHNRRASLSNVPDLVVDVTNLAAYNSSQADIRALKASLLPSPPKEDNNNNNEAHTITTAPPPLPHHHRGQQQNHKRSDSISPDEVMIIEGALQMKTKTAMDILVSFHKVFCIPIDMPLHEGNVFHVYANGYSRVPVYVNNDRRLVKGILLTRQLMVVKHHHQQQQNHPKTSAATTTTNATTTTTPADLHLHIPQVVSPETNLVDLVNLFQTGGGGSAVRVGHMALVCARPDVAYHALDNDQHIPHDAGLMGIITLEDVLETLLQEQIYDEMDTAGRRQHIVDLDPTIVKEEPTTAIEETNDNYHHMI